MRILFVHEVNYLNKVIYEMHEFPELLALRGHEVTFFHYPESPDMRRVSLRTHRAKISGRAYGGAEIDLVTPPTLGGRAFERYLAPLLNAPALRREIRAGRYDAIVLYAVPTTGWQTIRFAKCAGVPVVFRALDVSHQIRRTLVSALIKKAEQYIYRNAALISANNPAMAEYCRDASGRTGRTEVNLPPVDLTHFQAEGSTSVRSSLGLSPDNKIIAYMGSFFEFSGLDIVLRDLVPYLTADPQLRLLLIGGGTLDKQLRESASQYGISGKVIFTGIIPYAELPGYLKAADVAINPFRVETITNIAFPHKVLQYMAAGVPAVSSSLRGLRGVLGDDSGVTWASGPESVASEAVRIAGMNAQQKMAIAERQRGFVSATFSKESAATGFEAAITSVIE